MSARRGGIGAGGRPGVRFPGQELERPLEKTLGEDGGGLRVVLFQLCWALRRRRQRLAHDDRAIADVLDALGDVSPPLPRLGISIHTDRRKKDFDALVKNARGISTRYGIRTRTAFGKRVVSVVERLMRLLQPDQSHPNPKKGKPSAPKPWPREAAETPKQQHALFAEHASPEIVLAARDVQLLQLPDPKTLAVKLRESSKLISLIAKGNPEALAVAVLRAAGLADADDIIRGSQRMKEYRKRKKRAPA